MELRFEFTTTNLLIAFNIAMFVLTTLVAGFVDPIINEPFSQALVYLGGDVYDNTINGEVWRMLTSSFLHASPIHLIVNMYALYVFGNFFEGQFGGKKLLVLYVLAGIGGSMLSTIVNFIGLTSDDFLVSVGASGALFGLLGYLIAYPYLNIDKMQLYVMLFINLLIGLTIDNINNAAHIGGLLAGVAFARIYASSKIGSVDSEFLDRAYLVSIGLIMVSYLALVINFIL